MPPHSPIPNRVPPAQQPWPANPPRLLWPLVRLSARVPKESEPGCFGGVRRSWGRGGARSCVWSSVPCLTSSFQLLTVSCLGRSPDRKPSMRPTKHPASRVSDVHPLLTAITRLLGSCMTYLISRLHAPCDVLVREQFPGPRSSVRHQVPSPSSLTVSATRDNKLEMAHCSSPAVSQLASAKLQQLLSHVVLPSSCTLNCRFVRVSTCSKSAPGRPIR